MKSAWLKYGNKTFRISDVREPTAAEMLAVSLPPSTAHLYVSGFAPGNEHRGIFPADDVVKTDEWSTIGPSPRATTRAESDEWFWAIQYIDAFKTEREADEALLALSRQDGFLAGRTIAPSRPKPGWRAQVFFEDEEGPRSGEAALPDNLRRVMVRPSMLVNFLRRS